jgi:hypothetical protein
MVNTPAITPKVTGTQPCSKFGVTMQQVRQVRGQSKNCLRILTLTPNFAPELLSESRFMARKLPDSRPRTSEDSRL